MKLSVLRKNIISNILGKGFATVLSFIFVPYYIRLLGVEVYGLIGVFAILQSVFMIADLGLSGAFIRETARLSILEDGQRKICDLGWTFEVVFFFLGIIAMLTILGCSSLLAEHWVNAGSLPLSDVSSSIILMGIVIGLQFPLFIYHGGLQGIQKQTTLNAILVAAGLLKGFGAVVVLIYVERSIQTFFVWNVIVAVFQLVLARFFMWKSFPKKMTLPKFSLKIMLPLWRFAVGTAGITLTGILLSQADKVILAKMLSLESFGYYTLAWVVASVPGMIALPINAAVYPRLSQLVATQNTFELTKLYHRSCQFLAVLCLPVGLVLTFFSKEILFIWTGNAVTAENTFPLVSILVCGSMLMGLMVIPYSLQLAYAWTRLGLFLNIASIVVLIPSLFWLVTTYGALGACFVWPVLYSAQATVMIYFMHKRIIPSEKIRWYVDDVARPLLLPLVIVVISRLVISSAMDPPSLIASLVAIYFMATVVSAMCTHYPRILILAKFHSIRAIW